MKVTFHCFAFLWGSGTIVSSLAQSVQWKSDDRQCTYRGIPTRGGYDDDDHSGDGPSCQCPFPPEPDELNWEERPSNRTLLNAEEIPKFVTPLPIPMVMHDDQDEKYRPHDDDGVPYFIVALRQFYQQILPDVHYAKFPKTKVWGFGDPDRPETFSNPSNTLEATKDQPLKVVWVNDLVEDPDKCRKEGDKKSCNHLVHILEDRNGIPLVDQTLHWCNPPQTCADGKPRQDCVGDNADPYTGPICHVVHNHGAHVEPESDGYPEGWYLPNANTIPKDYATKGSFYYSKDDPFEDSLLQCDPEDHSYVVYRYRNDQASAHLWFHDHTLGITSLNAYAASAGSYIIREEDDGETYLAEEDCNGEKQRLPGPPARFGEDTNDPEIRRNIREIPLIIRDMSFYDDGSMWFPAQSMWFYTRIIGRSPSTNVPCISGELYGETDGLAGDEIPFLPSEESDIHPIANLIRTFNTIVVNGKTWPYLEVAFERYRFRIVQGSDSRSLNLSLKINYDPYHPERPYKELPFYVIGSDQGLQPHVGKAMSCVQDKIEQCEASKHREEALFGGDGPGKGKKKERAYEEARIHEGIGEQNFNGCKFGSEGLLIGPGERYDIIVDFSVLERGEHVTMVNLGYEGAQQGALGWPPGSNIPPGDVNWFDEGGLGVNLKTTGLVMKFIPYEDLNKEEGDQSTHPEDLILEELEDIGPTTNERILGSVVPRSDDLVCGVFYGGFGPNGGVSVGLGSPPGNCTWIEQECDGTNAFFALSLLLATNGNLGSAATPRKWGEPITENPALDSVEEWEFYNPTAVDHPIHVHQVEFEVMYRYSINDAVCRVNPDECKVTKLPDKPWEKRKDMVLVSNGSMARIKMKFDIPGRYVWHCHLLSHEDNEMMLPMCIGDLQDDCDEPEDPLVAPYFLWESQKWEERGFTDPKAEYDISEFNRALEELSMENNHLGVTATIFDADGIQVLQKTVGEYYCQGPFNLFGIFNVEEVCNVDNYVKDWQANTTIGVYSNSKMVSALVFLVAVGPEYLDEPLKDSLPDIFDPMLLNDTRKAMITPRQILSHTSGIPFEFRFGNDVFDRCFARFATEALPDANPQPSLDDCIDFLAYELPLAWEPGTQYEFSDLAFEIIAKVVEVKAGMNFQDAFKEKIADPLGLEISSYDCDISQSTRDHPHPAIGLCSNAEEFSKIVQMLTNNGMVPYGEQIIPEASVNEIFRSQLGEAHHLNLLPTDFLIRSPTNQLFSARCRPVPDKVDGISQVSYGLGSFQNVGTKAEVWQHAGFTGSKWIVGKGQYSIYFAVSYPFSEMDPLLYRVIDRFDRGSKFQVTPPGYHRPVEIPICSGAWLIDPALDEELPVEPPYFNITK